MDMNFEEKGDPTQKRYHITCYLKFHRTTVREETGKGEKSYERTLALLIPDYNDQAALFLSAWMPDTIEQWHEVTGFFPPPVMSPSRFSVHRGRDGKVDRPYLTVMSKGVEDILLNFKEGQRFLINIFKASEDAEADHAIEADHNFEVEQ